MGDSSVPLIAVNLKSIEAAYWTYIFLGLLAFLQDSQDLLHQ
jgi:hypothetical protein